MSRQRSMTRKRLDARAENYRKATDDYIARRRAAKKKYGKSLWDVLFGPD